MSIGQRHDSQTTSFTDSATGRAMRQFTAGPQYSYPLYYFVPSITREGDKLIFYSERSGWVQLYAMDLASGRSVQLTDGRTRDSGWAIWSEHHLRGIYNHIAALNLARREVYYFQDDEIRCTHVDTLANDLVHRMPGRMPIGQSAFSDDGRYFAFIHADRQLFEERLADFAALKNMGFRTDETYLNLDWRNAVPCVLSVIDTADGSCRQVKALDYHVHHVLWAGPDRLLINHVRNDMGMWTIKLDGSDQRHLRPRDEHGAVCHQLIANGAVYYETFCKAGERNRLYMGRYDLTSDQFMEFELPGIGYGHTGFDPAGELVFYEFAGQARFDDSGHAIFVVHHPFDDQRLKLQCLRKLPAATGGQREHAHPFLSPDRRWMFFTEVVEGVSQIRAMDVADLHDCEACRWPSV